jgi:hypothetical protein
MHYHAGRSCGELSGEGYEFLESVADRRIPTLSITIEIMRNLVLALACLLTIPVASLRADDETKTLRVFIFAGQSNMVGTHSRVEHIPRFPPFVGLDKPQPHVLFS